MNANRQQFHAVTIRFFPIGQLVTLCVLISCEVQGADPFTPPNFPLPSFASKTFNVKDFGAIGDGAVNDTPAINKAIEKCNAEGGGTVTFPDGKYSAASIHLKSNVRLQLADNAVIFGGP